MKSNKQLLELRLDSPYYVHKPEHYFQVYEWYWHAIRDQPVSVLEVGIHKGGSLQLWRDYFPNGQIHGIDCLPLKLKLGERVTLHQADQHDVGSMEAVAKKAGPFDIVIDDASHIGKLSLNTFLALFPSVKPNGLYIIEDWGTGYWEQWPDGAKPANDGNFVVEGHVMPSHQNGMVGFVKQLIDLCNTLDRTEGAQGSQISSMEIMPGLVVMRKAR